MNDDPPRITEITKAKGRTKLLTVTFSDGVSSDLDAETIVLAHWVKGAQIAGKDRDATIQRSRIKQAKDAALDMLGRRMLSEQELRRKLRSKRFADPVIDTAVQDLARVGLIDDRVFAERYSRDQMQRNTVGPYRLRRDLMQRGIAPELIDETLDRVYADTDDVATAADLLRKRGYGPELQDDLKRRQRAYAMLIRRGFDNETAQDALYRAASGREE